MLLPPMTDEDDVAAEQNTDDQPGDRRRREWAIFVVGGFIGSSLTYYLGEPVVWTLGILILLAPFIAGEQWWPQFTTE